MTPYLNPLAINGLPGHWPALPGRGAARPRSGVRLRRRRRTVRLLLTVALEAVVLLGTFQVIAGIGHQGQAGWAPTPGGVAPAGQAPLQAPLLDIDVAEPAPFPGEAPAPLPAPAAPPVQPR